MKRKNVGITLAVAGLLAGSFLTGGLLLSSGSSSAGGNTGSPEAHIVTPTATVVSPTATKTPVTSTGKDVYIAVDPPGPWPTAPKGGSQTGDTGEVGGSLTPDPATPVPPVTTSTVTPPPPATATAVPPTPVPPTVTPTAVPNEAPYVMEVTPGDDATGVALNTKIQVTFSEAMDQASAEAAFSISPNVSGSFSWDAKQRVMTFTPDASFEYNTKVEWLMGESATDASGLAMTAGYEANFLVLRQKTITLYSQPERDGFVYAPAVAALNKVVTDPIEGHNSLMVGSWKRGFLSFDLGQLPAGTVGITSAELSIHQRDHHAQAYTAETGALWVVSLAYDDLDISDYSKPTPTICPNICYPLGKELSSSAADGWKSVDVTALVKGDWNAGEGDLGSLVLPGVERLSQFRLQFLNENQGAGPDVWAEFHSGEAGGSGPRLKVTFVYK